MSEDYLPDSRQLEFTFNTPSTEWIVNYNLRKKKSDPTILVGGNVIFSGYEFIDNDILSLTFKRPQVVGIVLDKQRDPVPIL